MTDAILQIQTNEKFSILIFSINLLTTVVFPVPDGAEITTNFPVLSFMKRLKCKISLITEYILQGAKIHGKKDCYCYDECS